MIFDERLKSWLNFDASAATDAVVNNAWTVTGTPTTSSVNAVSGHALQLDGNSYLHSNAVDLGGQDFTIEFWCNISSQSNGQAVVDVTLSNRKSLVYVEKSTSYSDRLRVYMASGSTPTGEGGKYNATEIGGVGNLAHVAIVYQYNDQKLAVYVNGVQAVLYSNCPRYDRKSYYFTIGAYDGGSQKMVGSVDEFLVYDGLAVYTTNFTPPSQSYYSTYVLTTRVDTLRKIHSSSGWKYENVGETSLLINTSTAVQLTDLPANQSKTGVAFYQTTRGIRLFDIPDSYELWVKFDVYLGSSNRWRAYDYSTGTDTGVNGLTNGTMEVFNCDSKKANLSNKVVVNSIQTILLHMKSDASDGVLEVYTGDGELIYSLTGASVNNGVAFSTFFLQSGGAGTFFSNVVISNEPLWFDDDAAVNVLVSLFNDTARVLLRSCTQTFDIVRQIISQRILVDVGFDLSRVLVTSVDTTVDAERALFRSERLSVDIERKPRNTVTIRCDTQRVLVIPVVDYHDTERVIQYSAELTVDVQRVVLKSVEFNCDVWRQIPHKVNGNTTTLQSVTISLQEQQLTDNISFVHTGDIDIMDSVDITLLDYHNKCRAEETSTRGIIQTCKCASDIDAILYQQMAYVVPESEWEWTPEYLQAIGEYNETHEEQVEKIPSAPASAHITSIAEALGKSVSLHFTDYISTMNTEVSSGTNYAGLISELFGWTSRLPQMMINCYMRGDTIYVVQRGHEQHTVTIDNLQITVHTIQKKIVRTTWGSDPWSKTEVKPFYKDWSEFDQESYNQRPYYPDEEEEEEGGGASYGDDNLVEETTVENNGQTTVTTYKYETMPDGRKFLCEEVAVTYVNGVEIDRTTTTHKPVSDTQSHIYATDQDGEYIGGTVSQSNHDDRVSPYQKEVGRNSSSRDRDSGQHGVLVTGQDGNKYLLYGVIHHQDKGEMMRRTINGVTLIDTSFPVDGQDKLEELTQAIMWLDRKTEETVTLDIYNYSHIIDFNDKIVWHGHTYYLQSNNVMASETIVNKQTLTFVRWY